MARTTQPILFVMATLMAVALPLRTVLASDWRYCIAPSPAQHTIYMSALFPSDETMETTEAEFGQALDRAMLQHESVQCPRGEVDTIAGMKQQAIKYNEVSGNKVVQLNWRP